MEEEDGEEYPMEEEEDKCEEKVVGEEIYMGTFLLMSITLYIILTFTTKRKASCPACCNGRGGILLSVNFLENKTSRSMIIAAFALTILDVVELIQLEIPALPKLAKVFLRLTMVGMLNFIYLPLFHCISVNTFLRQCLGLVFVVVVVPLMLGNATSVCSFSEMTGDDIAYQFAEYFIVGPAAIYLIYKFIFRIISKTRQKLGTSEMETMVKDPYQVEYMKNLLKKDAGVVRNEGKLSHRFRKFLYRNLPGFRFSVSIQTSIVLGLLLFILVLAPTFGLVLDYYRNLSILLEINRPSLNGTMPNIVIMIAKMISKRKEEEESNFPDISIAQFLGTQLDALCVNFFLAAALAGVQVTCTIVFMLKAYRSNVLSMYRRELDIIAIEGTDNVSLVVSGIQYAGYQVAHMIWGYMLQLILFFALQLLFTEIIIIPLIFGYWGVILAIIDWIIPMVIVIFLSKFVQTTLVKRAFLVDRGNTFGIDNRKCFFNMMFFMFYYNLFIGLVACVFRVIKAALIGVWFFPRLDMSIFPHNFEKFDKGYKAYICLLRLEERQNNVILLTFVQLLTEQYKKTVPLQDEKYNDINLETTSPAMNAVRRKQALNRWFVAYTLIHNQSLQNMRRGGKKESPAIVCHSTVL